MHAASRHFRPVDRSVRRGAVGYNFTAFNSSSSICQLVRTSWWAQPTLRTKFSSADLVDGDGEDDHDADDDSFVERRFDLDDVGNAVDHQREEQCPEDGA